MSSKGISPLVAAMTIAGILAYWASSFVKTTLESKENKTSEILCSGVELEMYGSPDIVNVTPDGSVQNVTFLLHILNTKKLSGITAVIIYPNKVEKKDISRDLTAPYDMVTVPNVDSGYTEIKITTSCPNVEVSWKP